MADQPETLSNGADNQPSIGLIAQYVKDLSFENPNAPSVYQWQTQPDIDVQFNISTDPVNEEVHEVALKITVKATTESGTAFAVDMVYGALFGMRNVPDEQVRPFMLAEAPRLIFPFARRVLADAVRDGGFPPLMLDPIDFGSLYLQQVQQADQLAEGTVGGNA